MKKSIIFYLLFTIAYFTSAAQDANTLVQKVKAKLELVNDYEATGKMKTNIVFLKVPIATIKLLYKKPNKLKIKNEKGVSFVPKGAVNINIANMLSSGKFTVLDVGNDKIGSTAVRVVKLLPEDDNADVVLSTLYIDAANSVIRKAKTTTKDNGTYEVEMSYGNYINYGLPDKIVFSFNTKDYKMPKGVTFDFEDGTDKTKTSEKEKPKKGTVQLNLTSYSINKGISDNMF